MNEKQITSKWTGIKERVMAWGLGSTLMRRLETLILGDYRSAFQSKLAHIFKGNEVILEVGAGSGYFSLAIAKKLNTGKVICLDLSAIMLQRLERKAKKEGLNDKIQILNADASSTRIDDESIALVVSNFVFHELSNPEAILVEILRILKPGGWVIITDFRKRLFGKLIGASHGGDAHGSFNVNELDTLLNKAGLNSVKVSSGSQYIIGLGKK